MKHSGFMLLELVVGLSLIMVSVLLVHHALVKLTQQTIENLQLLRASHDPGIQSKIYPVQVIDRQGQLITLAYCHWSIARLSTKNHPELGSLISLIYQKEIA